MTTTDTPRTDACPHCGAEEINPQEKSIRYKCGSKEDGVFSYTCQVNRVVELEAEVERLKSLLRESVPMIGGCYDLQKAIKKALI